jgi:hypothetical protein
MDFMKWINSLDELLYEVMSWFLFFPVTLVRTIVRPLDMMRYADRQLGLPEAEQYDAALSPPLFLALALLLAHLVSFGLGETDKIVADKNGLASMINDDASALAFRLVVFGAFPLLAAVRSLRRQRVSLTRSSLRSPFYTQCYPAAVFALGLSLGVSISSLSAPQVDIIGRALIGLSVVYYAVSETRWFASHSTTGYLRAMGATGLVLLQGLLLLLTLGFLLNR